MLETSFLVNGESEGSFDLAKAQLTSAVSLGLILNS